METTNPALTRAQLETLLAISQGQVSKVNHTGADFGTWRLGGHTGRAVTVQTETLIRKGFARRADAGVDGRLFAVATPRGHEAISRAAHRGR
jgi:hypothetical protein